MSKKHYDWRIGESLPLLGNHSVAKHEISEQYLGIYIERLTRTFSQTMLNLTIVDGFCGGGLYQYGGGEEVFNHQATVLPLVRSMNHAGKLIEDCGL